MCVGWRIITGTHRTEHTTLMSELRCKESDRISYRSMIGVRARCLMLVPHNVNGSKMRNNNNCNRFTQCSAKWSTSNFLFARNFGKLSSMSPALLVRGYEFFGTYFSVCGGGGGGGETFTHTHHIPTNRIISCAVTRFTRKEFLITRHACAKLSLLTAGLCAHVPQPWLAVREQLRRNEKKNDEERRERKKNAHSV